MFDLSFLYHQKHCKMCGLPLSDGTRRELCHTCRVAMRIKERHDQGLCIDCEAPAYPGKSRCADCLRKQAMYQRQRREKEENNAV